MEDTVLVKGKGMLSFSEPYLGILLTPGKGVRQLSQSLGAMPGDLRRICGIFRFW